jgi:hypothetical protein
MTTAFLDEQLGRIYLTENVEKGISQLKTKSQYIVQAMKSGNLFKARTILNTLPDASLDEVLEAAHKDRSFHKYHLQAKRIARGDSTDLQKIYVITYACLNSLKEKIRDESIIKKIDEQLIKLGEFAKKYGPRFTSEGATLSVIMWLLSFFFSAVPILGEAIALSGTVGILVFLFGIFIYVVRMVLNTYFNIKGIK